MGSDFGKGESAMTLDLNSVLRESLKLAHEAKKEKAHAASLDVGEASHSSYADPANWVPSRLVGLVHLDPNGVETSLGVFQELLYTKDLKTRKLVRAEGVALSSEIVRGAGWLDNRVDPPIEAPSDEFEVRAYLSRRLTAETKESLKKMSAEDTLDDFLSSRD